MTTMTLDLPETLYQQLHYRSQQSHRSIEVELLTLLVPKVPVPRLPILPLAYQEVIEFLGQGTTAQAMANFRPSPKAQERAKLLLQKNREDSLTTAEMAELDMYVDLENFIALLKIQAYQRLSNQS